MPSDKVSAVDNALSIVADTGRLDRKSLIRGAVVIFSATVIGFAFVWSYVGGLHQPAFHRVPIAVVGPPALSHALGAGGQFAVTPVGSERAAVDRIDDRNSDAAIVVGPHGIDVLVASLAGLTISDALRTLLPPKLSALAPHGTPVRVLDVKPAPKNDPLGLSPFFLALSVAITNYIGAVLFALSFGVKPVGRRVWWRLLAVSTIGVILALGEVGITYLIGPLQGHYVTFVLSSLLLGLSVSFITVGLQSFIGVLGTTVAILVFVILGNPASGGPVPTQLLPGIWRTLGPYLPAGAGTDLYRNIAYFGGHALARPLLVLFAWLLAGVVFALASVRAKPHGLQMKDDFDRQEAASRAATAPSPQSEDRRAA